MTIHGPSVRTVFLSTAFCLLFSLVPRSFGADEARPIASLTPEERSTGLPDGTVVTLNSGRTATLGVLRAEHRARLERFTKAAELGKMVAAKLAAQLARSTQPSQGAKEAAKAPSPTPPSGGANPSQVSEPPDQTYHWHQDLVIKDQNANKSEKGAQPIVSSPQPSLSPVPGPSSALKGRTEIAKPPSLVPLILSSHLVLAKDWWDFCHAANASACLYLPANTTFSQPDSTAFGEETTDVDPLVTDVSVCIYDNGSLVNGECVFAYPVSYYGDFKPTGAVSATASCDPPGTYVLDPKGAIKVDAHQSQSFTTGSTPQTCVVQVWMYQ